MSSWNGYMLLGNSWEETISNVELTHKANGQVVTISADSLGAGEITEVKSFIAYSNHHDDWSVKFTNSSGKTYEADFSDEGFKEEDADAVLFAQITKENKRCTLYFPVSSDVHKSLD